jgi:hypothetical protein
MLRYMPLLLTLLAPPAAWAAGGKATVPDPRFVKTEGVRTGARKPVAPRRVIRLKGDVIEGKVRKPEALYILHRTGMSFEGLDPNTKLVPKIYKSLRKTPF